MNEDIAIFSARDRTKRVTYDYIFKFEDLVSRHLDIPIITQSRIKFYFLRASNILGFNIKYPKFSLFKNKELRNSSTIIICAAHEFELPILETIDFKDKNIILYIVDALEPSLEKLKEYIDRYDINITICGYLQIAENLQEEFNNVYWLAQGFDNTVYKDYGLEKEFTAMQVGRKHPKVHSFFLNYCKQGDYINHFIKGNEKLAKFINRSMFFGVTPMDLVYPEKSGKVSPVSQRYFLGMGCKSMLVGFKTTSKEFDILFPKPIKMIEFNNETDFKEKIEYYLDNKDEYNKIIDNNFNFVHENHTWNNRIFEFENILKKEGI